MGRMDPELRWGTSIWRPRPPSAATSLTKLFFINKVSSIVVKSFLIQFSLFYIAQNHKLRLSVYDIRDLWPFTLDQEQLPKKYRENPFRGVGSEETFRRASEEDPSRGWTDVMWPDGSVTELHEHIIICNCQIKVLEWKRASRETMVSFI